MSKSKKKRQNQQEMDQQEQQMREQMLAIVDQQIQTGNPASTRRHHRRLLVLGMPDEEAKAQIAFVVSLELVSAEQLGAAMLDADRFEQALSFLPLSGPDDTRLDAFYGI